MAQVSKSGVPSLSSLLPPMSDRPLDGQAGEEIQAGDLCRKHSDGKVYKCNGASAATAHTIGPAFTHHYAGKGVTTCHGGVTLEYGSNLTPGQLYWLSETVPGGLQTTVNANAPQPVAYAFDTTRIRFIGEVLQAPIA